MRKIVTILLLAILPLCSYARRHEESHLSLRDSIIVEATKHLGKRYQYAGKGPHRFDCSGFTGYVFRQFGYDLAASSVSQYLQGDKVSLEDAKKGDLIFFKGSNAKSKGVGHVGIVYEVQPDGKNTTLRFIHASVNSGITIDNYSETEYYRIRYIGIKRIIGEEDPTLVVPDKKEENTPQEEVTPQKEEKEKEQAEPQQEEKKEEKQEPTVIPVAPEKEETHKEALVHIVQKKETLFKIAKMYDCSVEDLMRWNNLKNTYLKIDQRLIIQQEEEVKREVVPEITPVEEVIINPTQGSDTTIHIVKAKETLYRISKIHGCTVEEIQEWNHLKGTALKIGQNLIIIKKE